MAIIKENLIGYELIKAEYELVSEKWANTNSEETLLKKYKQLKELYYFFNTMQLTTKDLCNTVYGGFGTPSLRYYNPLVAEDITGEARNACKLMEKTNHKYFNERWHIDDSWHNILREKFPNIMRNVTPRKIEKDIVITCDTDSVAGESILDVYDHEKCIYDTITIADYFDGSEHQYTKPDGTIYKKSSRYDVLNWSKINGLFYDMPILVIGHKVSKPKWLLSTENGKSVNITNDHSLVVIRKGNLKEIKPREFLKTDLLVTKSESCHDSFDIVKGSCVPNGDFENEMVYDLVMSGNFDQGGNKTQTFMANDILVHNSNYVTFDYVFESLGLDPLSIPTDEATEFIVYFMREKMDVMYNKVLENMISKRNGNNYMVFELEAVGGFGIFLAKKKYVYAKLWEDGKYIANQKKLKVTGIELKQRASSKEVKDIMKGFINYIFVKKGQITAETFFSMCKAIKEKLLTYEGDELAKSTKLNKYDEYVISDFPLIKLKSKTPMGVKGSANYNHLIKKNDLQWLHPLLKDGMAIKIYYDKEGRPFAYPSEYGKPKLAPPMSKNIQIEKVLFNPIRRLVDGLFETDMMRMGDNKMQKSLGTLFNKFKK